MAKKDIALSREFSRAPSQHSIMKPNKRKRRGSNSQFGGGVCNTAFNANDHLSTTREVKITECSNLFFNGIKDFFHMNILDCMEIFMLVMYFMNFIYFFILICI